MAFDCQSDVRLGRSSLGSTQHDPQLLFFFLRRQIQSVRMKVGVALTKRGQLALERAKRVTTGPLPRVPGAAMRRAQTLESRMPLLFGAAFMGLVAIQAWLALG